MLLYEDHEAIVQALAFSPDGSHLASAARDGMIVVRDSFGDAVTLKTKPPHSLGFRPHHSLVLGFEDGWTILRVKPDWDISQSLEAPDLSGLTQLGSDRLVLGFGSRTGAGAGMFHLYDLRTNRILAPTFREAHGVRAVAACPGKMIVAWSTGQREVKVWDIRKQTPWSFRTSHTCPALALAPDGSALAAVQDWAVRVIDLNSKQDRAVLKGHKGIVSCVAFSPDGSTIATGSWDQSVRLWDVASGQERAVFQWPVGQVFSLAYAPDGQRLAVGGDKGAVLVWDVE